MFDKIKRFMIKDQDPVTAEIANYRRKLSQHWKPDHKDLDPKVSYTIKHLIDNSDQIEDIHVRHDEHMSLTCGSLRYTFYIGTSANYLCRGKIIDMNTGETLHSWSGTMPSKKVALAFYDLIYATCGYRKYKVDEEFRQSLDKSVSPKHQTWDALQKHDPDKN